MTLEQLQKKYPKATTEQNGKDGYSHSTPNQPDRGRWVIERFELDDGSEAILAKDWVYNKTHATGTVLVTNPH